MGKDTTGDIAKDLEDLLGLRGDDEGDTDSIGDDSDTDEIDGDEIDPNDTVDDADVDDEQKTDDKTIDPAPVFYDQRDVITKEIAKIEIKLDELKNSAVDMGSFYDNLDQHLSEEEQSLEFENKSKYMLLVARKAKEYEESHSNTAELEKLEASKAELEGVMARQAAIASTMAKYPTYNHQSVMEFFENKLSKDQQNAIFEQYNSYEDVYEKTFILFAERNKINIKSQDVPKLPNVNKTRKQAATNREVGDAITSDDERLANALGLE